jgi:hypothetical protein
MSTLTRSGAFLALCALALAGCKDKDTPADDSGPGVDVDDTGGDGGDDTAPTGDALPDLQGVTGSDGALLWVETPPADGVLLERSDGGDWVEVADAGGGEQWVDEAVDGASWRLRDPETGAVSNELTPEGFTTALDPGGPAVLLGDDELAPSLRFEFPDVSLPVTARVMLTWESPLETRYLDGACVDGGEAPEDCWTDGAVSLAVIDDFAGTAEVSVPAFPLEVDAPVEGALTARLVVDPGDGSDWMLGQASATLTALGVRLVWGDLHAHSNISHDGCELPDENCAPHLDADPGGDFFASAIDRELDFAALTDHSEYVTYYPDGDNGEPAHEVWTEQKALVTDAEAEGGIVALLGYEWTYGGLQEPQTDGHFIGGHKTVVFKETDICPAYRIAAVAASEVYTKGIGGAVFYAGNPFLATGAAQLFSAFDAAAVECGERQVLSFWHHPAYEWPQPVDFTLEANRPDPDYEMLLEVYSEHGSSECRDKDATRCSWNLKTQSRYWGQGSVQEALSQGYKVGFTAGTDAHNARPGSTDDDPSCTANFKDTDNDGIIDSASCHDYRGGVTGVLVSGELDRDALWEGFTARHTVAASGPRQPLRVAAIGVDGLVYLPGDALPPSAMPARLVASFEGHGDTSTIVAIDLVAADGTIQETTGGEVLEAELDLATGEAVYVRVALEQQGAEQRIWASPFFGDE